MKIETPFIGFALAVALIGTASAQQRFFDKTGEQFIAALRAQIDSDKALVPIPALICGKPAGSRYCQANVTPSVRLAASEGALAGNKLYEVAVTYDPRTGEPADGAIFDSICAASIRVFRPKLSAASAGDRYRTALRRATNAAPASAVGIGKSSVKGSPDTFAIEVEPGRSISCKITSQPD